MQNIELRCRMRAFNYTNIDEQLFDKEIISLLTELHEYRGKQELYMESYPDVLEAMVRVAKIQTRFIYVQFWKLRR